MLKLWKKNATLKKLCGVFWFVFSVHAQPVCRSCLLISGYNFDSCCWNSNANYVNSATIATNSSVITTEITKANTAWLLPLQALISL